MVDDNGVVMSRKKISRRVTRIETRPQFGLFEGDPALSQAPRPSRRCDVRFVDPDPREIRFGVQRLDEHLRAMGLRDALMLRELLREQDWSAFEARYSAEGRPGYAPWLVAGVVLFGLMRGVSSLRELERFTRGDLECMWVSGGITPDHSVLGRFILRHEEELSGALFEAITQAVLRRTGSGRTRLAGDATVLEAMSSRFALIKREALEVQRAALRAQAASAPEDTEVQAALAEIEQACAVLAERPRAKAMVAAEPEAGLLKLKNGRGSRPAYQAAVLANEARVVVDAQVHSTSEQAALAPQIERLDGAQTKELLLDAGFNTYENLESALEKEISVLCPEQAEDGRSDVHEARGMSMREFRYVEDGDYYVCPAGERMHPWRRHAGNAATGQRAYVQYATPACADCERRTRCTRGEARTIQRTVGQELKEAMRLVMAQPRARRVFAQRKAMVEPVFSHLRERQGLHRFRRRGLAGVRLELRLHLMAYNLGRALAYARRGAAGGILRGWKALVTLVRAFGHFSCGDSRELGVTPGAHGHARLTVYG